MSKYIKPRHIFKISLLLTCFFLTIATAFSSFLLSGSRLSGYSSLSFGSQSTMYAWYPLITNSKCISIHSIIYFSLRICSMHVYDQNVGSVFVKNETAGRLPNLESNFTTLPYYWPEPRGCLV